MLDIQRKRHFALYSAEGRSVVVVIIQLRSYDDLVVVGVVVEAGLLALHGTLLLNTLVAKNAANLLHELASGGV